MKYKTAILVISIAVLCASQAHAQRVGGAYPPGTNTCGDYLEYRKDSSGDSRYADWAWGFLSAYNLFGTKPQVQGSVSRGTILAYLDKYCRDEPLSHVITGVSKLARELGEKK